MALYLKELALLNTTTNEVVKLVNVMEGVEGSAVFGYDVESVAVQVSANRTQQYVNKHTLDIRVIDDADPTTQAILTSWANSRGAKYKASGYGGDTFLLWDEPTEIVFSRQPDGISVRRLLMTLDAVPGYNSDGLGVTGGDFQPNSFTGKTFKMPVYAGANMLGLFDVFRPVSSSTEIDSSSAFPASIGNVFAYYDGNGLFDFTLEDGTGSITTPLIFFPFDIRMTWSFGDLDWDNSVILRFDTYDASFLVVDNDEVQDDTFITFQVSDPTGIYYAFRIVWPSGTPNDDFIRYNRPAVRIGNNVGFVP
jgi:hypothetical protein